MCVPQDYKDKRLSDFADVDTHKRYAVSYFNDAEDLNSQYLFSSDDWSEVEQFVKQLNIA